MNILAKHLTKRINLGTETLTILEDISLNIESGESCAVVGVSGSGKSTLLGLLAGLDLPTEGQVFWDKVDLTELTEDARAKLRAKNLGFIFQSFQLLPNLTALENVLLPLELNEVKRPKSIAIDILDKVGLSERLNHQPRQLSGGEQQRVAIARAFATKPKILFADEPTGNLDQATGNMIINLLFDLNEQFKTTLICVTHDPAIGERCQRLLKLAAGKWVV